MCDLENLPQTFTCIPISLIDQVWSMGEKEAFEDFIVVTLSSSQTLVMFYNEAMMNAYFTHYVAPVSMNFLGGKYPLWIRLYNNGSMGKTIDEIIDKYRIECADLSNKNIRMICDDDNLYRLSEINLSNNPLDGDGIAAEIHALVAMGVVIDLRQTPFENNDFSSAVILDRDYSEDGYLSLMSLARDLKDGGKVVFLDVDRTLIYSSKFQPVSDVDSFTVFGLRVHIRPYCIPLLKYISNRNTIVVWSAGTHNYVKKIIEHLFERACVSTENVHILSRNTPGLTSSKKDIEEYIAYYNSSIDRSLIRFIDDIPQKIRNLHKRQIYKIFPFNIHNSKDDIFLNMMGAM